jgi:trigger factor
MKVEKNKLEKSQIELQVELSAEEFSLYLQPAADNVSKEVKVDGFRPGKVPYEILKGKVGEMAILEEAARIAINKTIEEAIKEHSEGTPVGQPKVDVVKLAPSNPFVYKVLLALIPEIKLGEYKDLKIKATETEVKEDEIEKVINDLREFKVQEVIIDREVKDTDKILVDIQMYLDNVPVEGGQGQGAAIIVGKNYIVPGFDKELIGLKKGETREFSLLYPEDHHMKNLAGKMVEFKVTIKDVYERKMPELNDQFAEGFGTKNLIELKENIIKSIEEQKKSENNQKLEREILENILEKSKFGDIPEVLLDNEVHNMVAEIEQGVVEQGGKFEDYLSHIGKTRDQLTLDLLPEAMKRVKVSLMVREIAKVEEVKVDNEEVEKHVHEMLHHYKDKPDVIKKIHSSEYKSYIANTLNSRKVIEKLKEWNVEK